MRPPLDVYYAITSVWSFLAWDRLRALVERYQLDVRYHPLDYPTVFAATGGLPLPKRGPARQRYRLVELERWTKRLGVELNQQPKFFPVDETEAAQLVLAAREQGHDPWSLTRAFMAAIWHQERDIADEATRRAILEEQGLDPAPLLAAAPAMAEVRGRETEQAIARGVFGAPFFIYGDEPFWGQDRLDFLERALAA